MNTQTFNVEQLKALARERGIKEYYKLRKAELIELMSNDTLGVSQPAQTLIPVPAPRPVKQRPVPAPRKIKKEVSRPVPAPRPSLVNTITNYVKPTLEKVKQVFDLG